MTKDPRTNLQTPCLVIGSSLMDSMTAAPPAVKPPAQPPKRRFDSRALPSEHTAPERIETEDDVLHLWTMPSFAGTPVDGKKGGGKKEENGTTVSRVASLGLGLEKHRKCRYL